MISEMAIDALYINILTYIASFLNMVLLFVYIFWSIIKETLIAINNTIPNFEKLLFVLCLYNLISFLDHELKYEYKFEQINTQINYLKISEEMWTEEIITRQHKYNKTIQNFENKLKLSSREGLVILQKRVDGQSKKEETNKKNIAYLTREVKKIKKDLNKYD